MQGLIQKVESRYKKKQVVDVKTGDSVKVHQKIKEGGKERVQIFEGLVIRTDRKNSLTSSITVRRIASGVGVEKSYLLHSPNVLKIEVVKRSKVKRNYISYIRGQTSKKRRLSGVYFDKQAVNTIRDEAAEAAEEKLHEEAQIAHEEEAKETEKAEVEVEKKVAEAIKSHEPVASSENVAKEAPKPENAEKK